MYCKNCGKEVNEGAAACLSCGADPRKKGDYCGNCGERLNDGAVICVKCGCATGNADGAKGVPGDYKGYTKTVMALVCFFLGHLGIHNFMLGESKKGIFKIIMTVVTCGIVGAILMLIDFVKILTDKYTVDPDALV